MPLVIAAKAKLEQDGINVAMFDEVKPDPLSGTVAAGVQAFTQHDADSIIAIGGVVLLALAFGASLLIPKPGEHQ